MKRENWLIFQHIPEEGPGLIAEVLQEKGHPFQIVHAYHEEIPPLSDGVLGLILLGGPMNVDEIDRFPFLRAERVRIQEAVERKILVFGICLGAQLIARALGARVWKGPTRELGFDSVELTSDGMRDPLFEGVSARIPVFQWHQDTFDLPKGAVCLASSRLYPHQAFRFGHHVYGFQFHVEVTPGLLKGWGEWMQREGDPSADEAQGWVSSKEVSSVGRVGRLVFERFFDVRGLS